MEGAEAAGTALDEFHFAMESLGDAVVAGEAPHADDLLGPVGEGLGEGDSGLKTAPSEQGDKFEKGADVVSAGAFVLGFE